MTISGSSIHEKLKKAVSDINSDYTSLDSQIDQYDASISRLGDERRSLLVKLAKMNLTELEADDIDRSYTEGRDALERVLQEKQERKSALKASMLQSNRITKDYESRLEKITVSLNERSVEIDTISKKIAGDLKNNPLYEQEAELASELRTQIEADKIVLDDVTKEYSGKADAIMNNRLFRYLFNKNHDSDNPKFLDGWVAKAVAYNAETRQFVTYNEMKTAYDYLTKLPQLMKKDLEEREAKAAELEKRIFGVEDVLRKKYGLNTVEKAHEQELGKRDELIAAMKDESDRHRSYDEELRNLENKNDKYYDKAISLSAEMLSKQSIYDLIKKVKKTPGTEDDKLVQRIETIDAENMSLQSKREITKAKIDNVSLAMTEMKDIVGDYDSKDFEAGRSYFPGGFDSELDTKIRAYLKYIYAEDQDNVPKMTKEMIWDYIVEKQKFKPKETYSSYSPSYSSGSSYRSSGSSYRPSSSGWSGGSRSSGGFSGGFGGGSRIGGGGFGGGARVGRGGF
jgi:chromosome segregation ATPase